MVMLLMLIVDRIVSFKVSRNFELVGRVNLDQLEQMKGKTESSSSDEEEKEEEMSPKTEDRGQSCFLFYAIDLLI